MEMFDGLFNGDPSYITKGCHASPKIYKPEEFYANYTFFTHAYLKSGLELWHTNPIKLDIISKFNLDKAKLYDLNKPSKESLTQDEIELAKLNSKLVLTIGDYVLRKYPYYDIFNLIMAIAIERVLKGLLLYNGYIIHEHKKRNKLTKISELNKSLFDKIFSEKVYSLDEFSKHNVLKNALPWEDNDDIAATIKFVEHLKMFRDMGVHCAVGINIFQIYDILAIKRADTIMEKAFEIDKIVYSKLEILKANGKNSAGSPYAGLDVTVTDGNFVSVKNESSAGNTPIALTLVKPDSPTVISTTKQRSS